MIPKDPVIKAKKSKRKMLSVQQEKESPGSVSSCGAKHVRTSWTELTVVKQQQGVV